MSAQTELAKYPVGKIVAVPMGSVLLHAIKIESFHTHLGDRLDDDLKQLIVTGTVVSMPGRSEYKLGEKMSFCIYWQ